MTKKDQMGVILIDSKESSFFSFKKTLKDDNLQPKVLGNHNEINNYVIYNSKACKNFRTAPLNTLTH